MNTLENQLIRKDKLYIPGDLFYIYKTSRSYPKHFVGPQESTLKDTRDQYVIEHSSFEHFNSLEFSDYWWLNHMPNKYHTAMKKAESHHDVGNLKME